MTESVHIPVMLEESMLVLEPRKGGVYVDGTLGGGSHTEALLRMSGPSGRVISFDISPEALSRAQTRFASCSERWMGIEANFAFLADELLARGISSVDGILLDLGFSSDQLLDPSIGISFQEDAILDMRLGPKANEDGLTAVEVVNTWDVQALADLFSTYADERYAFRIAQAIVKARRENYLVRTKALADVVSSAVPARYEEGRIHPATRVFLALRMVVNQELEHLKQVIEQAHRCLVPQGALAIITFQSIEDRVVKRAFHDDTRWNALKKPLTPSEAECLANPRARSAKLRVAHRLQ